MPHQDANPGRGLHHESFGQLSDGRPVTQYRLRNAAGFELRFLDLGGIVTAIMAPDRNGHFANVNLDHVDLALYEQNPGYFGAIIGRYANRIGGAAFVLGGRHYPLEANDGPNCLHGGLKGFDKAVWDVHAAQSGAALSAVLKHTSPDGDEGFPGILKVEVVYSLQEENAFRIDYQATTTAETVINLTNHAYFNLAGNDQGSVLEHIVEISAETYTPVDPNGIPTGTVESVAGTPLDFRTPKPIGAGIRIPHPQILRQNGYDHNFVLDKPAPQALTFAARAYEPKSGRIMEVETTEPGLQFYTANYLGGGSAGTAGVAYRQSDAFCFETQHFPDSPNKPEFPTVVLQPGHIFRSTTIYRFKTDRG
ncbi:MAG TPA: aldose epimerase family protein [Acidisoma sp.]|nr:aldose epimerase family protein [Acidisoma sp.]